MANRKNVNSNFVWYVDDDRLAVLYKNTFTGEYEPWDGDRILGGIRIDYISKYDAANFFDDDFKDDLRVDSGLHVAILDYVKHRLEEDLENLQKSTYFLEKYRKKISSYPHRRKGERGIKVPHL